MTEALDLQLRHQGLKAGPVTFNDSGGQPFDEFLICRDPDEDLGELPGIGQLHFDGRPTQLKTEKYTFLAGKPAADELAPLGKFRLGQQALIGITVRRSEGVEQPPELVLARRQSANRFGGQRQTLDNTLIGHVPVSFISEHPEGMQIDAPANDSNCLAILWRSGVDVAIRVAGDSDLQVPV